MLRIFDYLHFFRQIAFPNWTDDQEPTGLRRILPLLAAFLVSKDGTGTVFSIVLHVFVLVILSLIMLPQLGSVPRIDILGGFALPGKEPEAAVIVPQETEEVRNTGASGNSSNSPPSEGVGGGQASTGMETTPAPHPSPLAPHSTGGFVTGGGFANRSAAGRHGAMQSGDCTAGSENAVEAALEWLAAHQQKDGGWSLHFDDSCKLCSHGGIDTTNRRTAATALALLPFLGAGYTHQSASNPANDRYKTVVEKGLLFLKDDPNGGIDGAALRADSLRMYSHGLAAIALCEAFAMTKEQDPETPLGRTAQKALLFIETAQEMDGGGWRYRPLQSPGDTSVFAWQLMALKSGKLGGLHVSQSSLYAAQDFLDSVALEGGRRYQYLPTGGWDVVRGADSPKTCTAIGLLMRMYLGWKPGDPFLDEGMERVASDEWRVTRKEGGLNLYYAYYATLALHHYGGAGWEAWNREVRELLVRSQAHAGHESGSWSFRDPYCDKGGRLLNTALGAMILETPYRMMPLYRKR